MVTKGERVERGLEWEVGASGCKHIEWINTYRMDKQQGPTLIAQRIILSIL